MDNSNMEREILSEAETLFLEKGFAAATTTEIAKRVGCNQALIHYYFRTKEKLFEAVFFKKMQIFLSSFMLPDEEDLSFEEKLTRKIESHFDVLYKNQRLPFLILTEMFSKPEKIRSFKAMLSERSYIYSKFSEEFEKEIQAGRIRQVSLVDIIFNILALNISVFLLKPVTMEMLGLDEKGFNKFAKNRRKENVKAVIGSSKP